MKLIITKGIYPYEYMDSFEKFQEKQLPSIDKFYSSLNNETINNEQYQHALKVWETFNFKTLGEYHDFYLQTDVMRLTDVFENFREVDMNTYKLDPAHYITGCSFSMDASLKKIMITKYNYFMKDNLICIYLLKKPSEVECHLLHIGTL